MIRRGLYIGKYSWNWKYIIFFCLSMSTLLTIVGFFYVEKQTREKTRLILAAMGTRDTFDFVEPILDTTIIEPEEKSLSTCNESYLVIMIISKAQNFRRRKAIRDTWAKWHSEYNSAIYFFTGAENSNIENLQAESNEFGDMIVDEMEDNKYHLTVKTLRMLKWFVNKCSSAKFLVRVEDDVFLNIPILDQYLQDLNSTVLHEGFIGGLVHEKRRPHDRNPFSKWYVPKVLWENGTAYPPYIDSLCTIFSSNIVPRIFTASLETPLFHLPEIFLGIVASVHGNIKLLKLNSELIYNGAWPNVNYFFKTTEFLQNHLAYHCDDDFKLMSKLYSNSWAIHHQVEVADEDSNDNDQLINNDPIADLD